MQIEKNIQPSVKQSNYFNKNEYTIKFYNPYERLLRRSQLYKDLGILGEQIQIDLSAIYESILKRGGFQEVVQHGRWKDIQNSLSYYQENFEKVYQQYIAPQEWKLKKMTCKWILKKQKRDSFVEMHLLYGSSGRDYYKLNTIEQSLYGSWFANLDEYFTLKTIVELNGDFSRIPIQYASKYQLLLRWNSLLNPKFIKTPTEITKLSANNNQVVLVGCSLSNIICGIKLALSGLVVTMLKSTKSLQKWVQEQIKKQCVFFLPGGELPGSYYDQLEKAGLNLQGFSDQIHIHSNQMKLQTKILMEYQFYKILHTASENHKIWDSIDNRTFNQIKQCYYRYSIFNGFQKDFKIDDTINMEYNTAQMNSLSRLYIIKDMQNLLKKMKALINIVECNINHIEKNEDNWVITYQTKNKKNTQTILSKYIIYTNQQKFQGMQVPSKFKWIKYRHAKFIYDNKLSLQPQYDEKRSCSIQIQYGFIYYFLIYYDAKTQVYAIVSQQQNHLNFEQVRSLFEKKCLLNQGKLSSEKYAVIEVNVTQNSEFYTNIIEDFQRKKMFINIPYFNMIYQYLQRNQTICSMIIGQVYQKGIVKCTYSPQPFIKYSLKTFKTLYSSIILQGDKCNDNHCKNDFFALNHPIITNYINFIEARIQANCSKNKSLSPLKNIAFMEIQHSIELYDTVVLQSLGQPIFIQGQIFMLDRMVTYHQFYSIHQPNKTTIYGQLLLKIQKDFLYVIVDSQNLDKVYFHNSGEKLIISIINKVSQTSKVSIQRTKNLLINSNIFPELIRNLIQQQISIKGRNYDVILAEKLNNCTSSSAMQIQFKTTNPPLITNINININNNFDIITAICVEIEVYLRKILQNQGLKTLNIIDILMGKLTVQQIVQQILINNHSKQQQISCIENLNKQLYNEIIQILNRNSNNQFTIKINLQNSSRRFMKQWYCISKNNQQYRLHYNQQNYTKFTDSRSLLFEIVSILIQNTNYLQIIRNFKYLILNDLQNVSHIPPILKSYFDMIRLRPKCRSFQPLNSNPQKTKIQSDRKLIHFLNDYIYSY